MPPLEDLLVQSGAQNVERIARGWTPNPAEQRAQEIHKAKMDNTRLVNEKIQRDFDRVDTQDALDTATAKRSETHRITAGLHDLMSKQGPEAAVAGFQEFLPSLIANGTENDKTRYEDVQKVIESGDVKGFQTILTTANSMIPVEQEALRKQEIAASKRLSRGGGTVAERVNADLLARGVIDQAEYDRRQEKLGAVKSGVEISETTNVTLKEKKTKRIRKEEVDLRKESDKGTKHFYDMGNGISAALAAMDSGDNSLSDTMLGQVMSQVQDSNVRAFQMYAEFDSTYGDVAQRIGGGIERFISGSRTPEDKQLIKDTLVKFRDNYVAPANRFMRNRYRLLAKSKGHNAFNVVPPNSPTEIKNASGFTRDEKLKALQTFFPEKFQ